MFPCRCGRRNSCALVTLFAVLLSGWWVWASLFSCLRVCAVVWFLGSGRETPVLAATLSSVLDRLWLWWCVGVGQALGLLVPVGWALLLYTSGLSTPCSVGGLTRFVLWETLS